MQSQKGSNGSAYLSGGMQHADNLGSGWRADVTAHLEPLGFSTVDIAELDIAYTSLNGDLYRNFVDDNDALIRKSNIRRHFIHADTQLVIHHSDFVILYYDESVRVGAGTLGEMQVAYDHNIPIFVVNAYDKLDEVPGWLQACSTKICASFEELYEYLETLPAGILLTDAYGNKRAPGTLTYFCHLCGNPFDKQHMFVSTVSPLYCKGCVEITTRSAETYPDRYEFFKHELEGK